MNFLEAFETLNIINEADAKTPRVLYRACKTLAQRYNELNFGFKLNSDGEVDFADVLDISLGYGKYLLKIELPADFKFIEKQTYNVSDREAIVAAGFDGVKQANQYYIFNLEKLNRAKNKQAIVTYKGSQFVVDYKLTSQISVESANLKANQVFYVQAVEFEHNIAQEALVLCLYHDASLIQFENLTKRVPDNNNIIKYAFKDK